MEKICAIVDCQGFNISSGFYAREVAITCDTRSQCIELNPNLIWRDLSKQDRDTINHCTKYVHGLYLYPFNPVQRAYIPTSNDIGEIVKEWYENNATVERPLFGFKNRFMGIILKENNIPCYDLDAKELNFPKYDDLRAHFKDNYLCAYHKKPPLGSRIVMNCAYRKTNHLYTYINSTLDSMEENL